jgi:L-fuconolactonase
MRIDAHQHFWQYNPTDFDWITDDMAVIRRNFLPEDLKPLLQQQQFDGCVLVQTEQTTEGNEFLLQCAKENDFIKGIVGWIDLQAPDVEEQLASYQQHSRIKGFRHILQGEKQRDFMLQESFKRGIAALQKFDYTYDILIYPDQLSFTEIFVTHFPEQKFIIDHLAKPYIKKGEIAEWKKHIQRIAAYPNVYCKVSGMVTEADWKGWKKDDFVPYMDAVVEAFGVDRLLFGSDWPVCLVAASYSKVVELAEQYFQQFTKDEQEKIFGGNAVTFYNL